MRKCKFCKRKGNRREVTSHHYYPRPYRNKRYHNDTVAICDDTHRWLHRHYTNKELALYFNNYSDLYELLEDELKLN